MTQDEAFDEYEKAVAEIDKQAREAKAKAKTTLREQLAVLHSVVKKA